MVASHCYLKYLIILSICICYRDDESDDPDALYNPESEMTEEIQQAFAEFVRLNNR